MHTHTRHTYNGSSPLEPPRDNEGHDSDDEALLALPRQQSAVTARMQPRVSERRIGAPPGMYESRYHPTAAACSAEKSSTRMYECSTSAA